MATLILIDQATDPTSLQHCEEQLSKSDSKFTTSSDEWTRTFAVYGTYDGWSSHLATGVDYLTRDPVFEKFCCADKHLGKCNAMVITKALAAGKECIWFDGTNECPIVGIDKYTDDWTNGWVISVLGETQP